MVADCNPDYDLALLKIEAPAEASFSPAKFGVSKDVSVGDMVLSIGNPLEFANSFSAGIIRYLFIFSHYFWKLCLFISLIYVPFVFFFPSSVKRPKKEIGLEGNCQFYLQTDCALTEVIYGFVNFMLAFLFAILC